jgi:equilibrative nucleoside transporter 1/2/3
MGEKGAVTELDSYNGIGALPMLPGALVTRSTRSTKHATEVAEPTDRYNLVYAIFYWLGVVTLLPWNMFLSVAAYWDHKFRPLGLPSEASGQGDLQKAWGGYLALANMAPICFFLILNGFIGHRIPTFRPIVASLVFLTCSFVFTAAMVWVNTDAWQYPFLYTTLASVVFICSNCGVFEGAIVGVAGKFPPAYTGAIFSGQAVGGIIASGTNVAILALGADATQAAFGCFLASTCFLATGLAAFLLITRTDFYKHHESVSSSSVVDAAEGSDLLEKEMDQVDGGAPPLAPVVRPWRVLLQILPYALAVFLTFLTTLAIYPAVSMQVVSTSGAGSLWADKFFVPVSCFLLFNIGDFIGRFLAGIVRWPQPGRLGGRLALGFSLARFVFLPLVLLCNLRPDDRQLTDVMFQSDAAYMVIMGLFSVSNGFINNTCMMAAPQLVRPEEAHTAANLMVAALGLGLGLGALVSNFTVRLI